MPEPPLFPQPISRSPLKSFSTSASILCSEWVRIPHSTHTLYKVFRNSDAASKLRSLLSIFVTQMQISHVDMFFFYIPTEVTYFYKDLLP